MSIIRRIVNSFNINFDNPTSLLPTVNPSETKSLGNVDEWFRSLSADLNVTQTNGSSAITSSRQTKSIQSSIKVSDPTSAAQLETDLKAILRPDEQKNIKIQNGKLVIVDASAVNPKTSSKAYASLLQAVKSGKTFNYNAVQPNSSVTMSDGRTLSWNDVRGGATVPIDTNDLKTAKVVDIFVPTAGAPDVFKKPATQNSKNKAQQNDEFISFPREIVTAHELLSHGLCGAGRRAVSVENEIRKELSLPERSGADHDILETEKGEKRSSTKQEVEVVADFGEEKEIESTSTKIITEITPRKLEPLPSVRPPR